MAHLIKRPSGLLVNNSITFLACPGSQNFDNPAQNTFSRAVTVKPGRKGGFDSETTPRECRGEVDVEEVGCQCCCCGFGGRDFVIFFGDAAGRTLNTNWSCRVNSICMWPVCSGHMFFIAPRPLMVMRFHFQRSHPVNYALTSRWYRMVAAARPIFQSGPHVCKWTAKALLSARHSEHRTHATSKTKSIHFCFHWRCVFCKPPGIYQ